MPRFSIAPALASLLLTVPLSAQAPEPVEKPKDPPKAAAPAKPPVFSDLEKAAIDVMAALAQRNAALTERDRATCALAPVQAQQRDDDLRVKIATFRQQVRVAYPGYDWDVEKGTLVPLPAAKAAPK